MKGLQGLFWLLGDPMGLYKDFVGRSSLFNVAFAVHKIPNVR